jgi:hypothetical protein
MYVHVRKNATLRHFKVAQPLFQKTFKALNADFQNEISKF